ncbi:MAG: Calx-beta domain-containing protein [Chitinophagales bacterium]
MKKINKIQFLSLITLISSAFLIGSCKKEENKDYSKLIKTDATVSLSGVPAAVIVREDTAGVIISVTASLSEPQIVEVHIPISQISGDATEDEDFSLSTHELVFPANSTEPQTFEVEVLDDDLPETDETFTIQVGDDKTANVNITPVTMDVTITNATSLDLDMSFAWNRFYTLKYWDAEGNDTSVSTVNAIDLDFYVFDSLGSAVGNDQGIYDAATGSHPENLTLTAPDQEGVYVISANLWANIYRLLGYGALSLPQGPFPVTTTFSRKGVLEPITLEQDEADAFNTNTEDSENDGASEFRDLFKVDVKPDMFIIYNIDGSEFATARRKLPFYQYHKHASLPRFR